MPEYSMSDFLQGRSPVRQSLQDVWQQMLRNGEMEPSDLAAVMAAPTLGGNIAMRPPSAPTISNGKGSVQPIPTQEALGQHNVLSRLLSSVGQSSYDMVRADIDAFRRTGQFPEHSFTELMSVMPMGPARAPGAFPRTAPTTPPPASTGPWQPGHMESWLQGRYQPLARPQAWQADRRFGTVDRPGFHWTDVPAGRLNRFDFSDPLNRSQLLELGKGAGAAGAAGGVGGAAGMYVTDTLVHGEPWQSASWRALVGPSAGDPPSWWPQAPPAERSPPPNGPQPPSRSRSAWVD
jgi:hypothetical protein